MSVLSQEIEWSCIFGLGVSTVSLFLRIICPVYDSRGGGGIIVRFVSSYASFHFMNATSLRSLVR